MKGIIVAYDSGVQAGVIKGSDKKAYFFTIADWNADGTPAEDQAVTFEAGPWRAFSITCVSRPPASKHEEGQAAE